MTLRASRLTPLVLLGLLMACGSNAVQLRPIPESQFGTYRFTDRVSAASPTIVVEGEFTIQADTIVAGVTLGSCQPMIPPSTQSFNFRCGQVSLSFDRRNPLQRATYSVEGTAIELQRVCVRFTVNQSGQQICVQYGNERVQVARNFGGRIRPIPVP